MGFIWAKHSAEFAALELFYKMFLNMDKLENPIGIFLIYQLKWTALIMKYCYRNWSIMLTIVNALNLMKCYLTDHKQFLQIDDTQSDFSNITTGVWQGSNLGPLLFIIYINDICQASKLFDFIKYANHTSLSTTLEIILNKDNSTSIENTINNELVNINDWLKLNKLALNIQKTKYIIFHTLQKCLLCSSFCGKCKGSACSNTIQPDDADIV